MPPRSRLPLPFRRPLPGFALALLLLAVLVTLLARRHPPPSPDLPAPSSPASSSASLTPQTLAELTAIEARENALRDSLWQPEMIAQQHGRVIDELWDALNAASDPWLLLHTAPIPSLVWPAPPQTESLPHGIQRWFAESHPDTPAQPGPDWRAPLEAWIREGWQLAQSEWRHVAFQPASAADPAASTFLINLHLTRDAPPARAQVSARVRMSWPHSPPRPGPAALGPIVVEHFETVRRHGPPLFQPAAAIEVDPFPRTSWIDPIIPHDLDGDGHDEWLLVARNLVLRRHPDGQWSTSELTPHHPGLIFTALLADFTGNGRADLLLAVRTGLVLLRAGPGGAFDTPAEESWRAPEPFHYAQAFTCGDIDGDGLLDVFLGQYRVPYQGGQMPHPYFNANDGPPAYLLRNVGDGRFEDITASAGPEARRHRRSYAASFVDLDGDGHLDLLVTSDFAGLDAYANDGTGRFTDRTAEWFDDPAGFGMAHALSDFDADGRLDVLLVGMPQTTADRLESLGLERPGFESWARQRARMTFGNRLFFGQAAGGFQQRPAGKAIARAGWAWDAAAADLDHNGFPDLYFVNGHESRASVRDYEVEFWNHDIYVGDSTPRPAVDAYFSGKFAWTRSHGWSYGGYHPNHLHLNLGGDRFVEVGHLFGLAIQTDCRNVVAHDIDGDGRLDLLVTTHEVWPRFRQAVRLYRNAIETAGHWIAFRLVPTPGGIPLPGTTVTLRTPSGTATRVFVTGDAFRAQRAPILHFGLGDSALVDEAILRWPGGREQRIPNPEPNRTHLAPAPGSHL
ncbi:MAG: CRTAC1 family protein [Verrucomicrobiae bacterium]|nr:CRTAC1 family protein [Verrucomicrobiae bacterium]